MKMLRRDFQERSPDFPQKEATLTGMPGLIRRKFLVGSLSYVMVIKTKSVAVAGAVFGHYRGFSPLNAALFRQG